DAVAWCQAHVTPRFPHFRFRHADLHNAVYNPHWKDRGATFSFPYADRSFDFVYLTSVFTHLLPPELERYLAEMARVMRPGARALATFFLLNPDAREGRAAGRATLVFPDPADGVHARWRESAPEAAVAYEEAFVREIMARQGLAPRIHFGSWCGRREFLSYQDVV